MRNKYEQLNPVKEDSLEGKKMCDLAFFITILIIEEAMIGIFALISYQIFPYTDTYFTRPDTSSFGNRETISAPYLNSMQSYYKPAFDVLVMTLVGFGFLSAFVKFHRWMSLGLSFFIIMVPMQMYILWYAFWYKTFAPYYSNSWTNRLNWQGIFYQTFNEHFQTILMDNILMTAKAAFTVLISIGALIGRIDAFQALILACIEVTLYALNNSILFYAIGVRDIGGSMYIHIFGSTFGLVASFVYEIGTERKFYHNYRDSWGGASLAFLGTYFLWILFPTFNMYNRDHAYFFSEDEKFGTQFLAAANTFFALTTSTIFAFLTTLVFNGGKLKIEAVLNSTLSGAVMIAASCDMFAMPYPPLIVGAVAGIVSTICFEILKPYFAYCCGLLDTRGVFCLHFVPGVLGCFTSGIAMATLDRYWFVPDGNHVSFRYKPYSRWSYIQGGFQIVGGVISFGFAFIGGLITGLSYLIFKCCCGVPIDIYADYAFFKLVKCCDQFNGQAQVIKNDECCPLCKI